MLVKLNQNRVKTNIMIVSTKKMMLHTNLCVVLFCIAISHFLNAGESWQNDLYIGGGDYWRQRIKLVFTNSSSVQFNGEPVQLTVGNSKGEISIVNQKAESIRVADENGNEYLWAIYHDSLVKKGVINSGAKMIVPVTVPTFSAATFFIYFDNPSALAVPDFYSVSTSILNGDLEQEINKAPAFWQHDKSDDSHKVYYNQENPHSGNKCLKTVVADGSEPSWISTRQTNIRIHPGARYKFSGYVKAQNVKGSVGWYVHVGNSEKPFMIGPMATIPGGTFDWKEVSVEFTAPTNADRISVGTVLYGTGTAYFDDAKLEPIEEYNPLKLVSINYERLPEIKEYGAQLQWITKGKNQWVFRVPIRFDNLSEQALENNYILGDLAPVLTRYRNSLNLDNILVVDSSGNKIQPVRIGNQLLIDANIKPLSRRFFNAYFTASKKGKTEPSKTTYQFTQNPALPGGDFVHSSSKIAIDEYKKLLTSSKNLVKNPDFETGENRIEFWSGGEISKEVKIQTTTHGLFGNISALMFISTNAPKGWRGLRQTIQIRGGGSYLYSSWVKCSNVVNGAIKLHAHAKTANGEICKNGGYISVGDGLTGNQDWVLLNGIIKCPKDATQIELHLTTDNSGEIYYDGVVFVELKDASVMPIQLNPELNKDKLTVWQVPSIIKVFYDDIPITKITQPNISAAKNERESLQLAVRSIEEMEINISVTPPENSKGHSLPAPEVGVVDYVPIDFVSGYYQTTGAEWHRKKPTYLGGSDGWAGFWPDPIIPVNNIKLQPNQSRPIWLTFKVPQNAFAGNYKGTIKLICKNKTINEVKYTLHIWDFEIPEKPNVKAIYDVRGSINRWAPDGFADNDVKKAIWEFMSERRLCPDTIRPEPKIQFKNGKVEADFTAFDSAAKFYIEKLKLPHFYTPWQFYCFGWGLPPWNKFGEAPYSGVSPYEGIDRENLRPEFKKAYQQCLKVFWEHLKSNGWDDECILYISDEPFDNMPEIRKQMKALCNMIHEVDSSIPIYSSTWHHQPEWDGYITVWGLGHYGIVPPNKLKEIKNTGARILWTTDGQMCIDTPFLAVERLLPHYCFHYGVEGYEFWGFDWLTYDPYEFGWHSFIHQTDQPGRSYWVRYPNGDGYLIYPGKKYGRLKPIPSIRSELAAEGCEDYEYLYLLKQKINSARKNHPALTEAKETLEFARSLVFMPNAGGRFSSRMLPNPLLVYEARNRIATAIEKLKD